MTAAVLTVSVGIAAPSGAEPTSTRDTSTSGRGPGRTAEAPPVRVVPLHHPVSVQDAMGAAASGGIRVVEYRFDGNGVVGGLIPDAKRTPAENAAWAEQSFRSRFDRAPVVAAVVLEESRAEAEGSRLRAALAAEPAAAADAGPASPVKKPAPSRAARTAAPGVATAAGQDFDEHFPSMWHGYAFRTNVLGAPFNATENYFAYETGYSSPSLMPDDWGMEIGITIYNRALSGSIRPFCPFDGGDSDYDFWAHTWLTDGAVWGTNVSSYSAPYADYNIQSDECYKNSLEIGIGFPRTLAPDTFYLVFSETGMGTKPFSVMSAAMGLVSNDCNNMGSAPHTDCMGLQFDRQPPAGVVKGHFLVNENRQWTVPGCFINGDGFEAPEYVPSGTHDCPPAV